MVQQSSQITNNKWLWKSAHLSRQFKKVNTTRINIDSNNIRVICMILLYGEVLYIKKYIVIKMYSASWAIHIFRPSTLPYQRPLKWGSSGPFKDWRDRKIRWNSWIFICSKCSSMNQIHGEAFFNTNKFLSSDEKVKSFMSLKANR